MEAIRDLDEEDTGRIRRKMREMKRVLKTGAVSQELYDRKMSGITGSRFFFLPHRECPFARIVIQWLHTETP